MKILELRFKNLNSLYGDWRIDFTHPDYVANGIFALIGPTGAGKSTVLDAICLALYGATPRLGKITQSSNEIMSRQTGECYAEVLFATHDGQYRAHWQQRRARKQADGALQSPIHEIIDASNAQIIESKKSLVAGVVEQKTGMDFDRFTRAILLAQGGFDTFLKADVEQKSTILEQITGTEIYSVISIKVFERQREEAHQLALLQAKADGVELLSTEAEQALEAQQITLREKLNRLNAQSQTLEKEQRWLNALDTLEQSLSKLADEKADLAKKQTAFAPFKNQLERGRRAASMEAVYIAYEQLRRQQEKDQAALHALQTDLPKIKRALKTAQQLLDEKRNELAKYKKTLADKQPLLKEVRALDVTLQERKNALAQLEQDMAKQTALIENHHKEIATVKQDKSTVDEAMACIAQYEQSHSQDANLLSELGTIKALYEDWQARRAEIEEAQATYDQKVKALHKQQTQRVSDEDINKSQQVLARVDKVLKTKVTQRETLLAGQTLAVYREQLTQLQSQAQLMAVVASLAEQRALLSEGEPCPLCGAREHPYAAHADSNDSSTIEHEIQTLQTKMQRIETLNDEINQLQSEQYAAERAYDQLVGQHEQQQKELNYLADHLREQYALLAQNQQRADEKAQNLGEKMANYGLGVNKKDMLALEKRLQRWQKNIDDKQKLTQKIDHITQQLQRLVDKNALYNETLAQYKDAFVEKQKHFQEKQNERLALLGEESPEAVETQLQHGVDQAQTGYDSQYQREQASAQAVRLPC